MTLKRKKIKVGTRGSKLALTQTGMACDIVRAAHPDIEIELVIIKASGDWKPEDGETRLSEREGGKGQFVKNIEIPLLNGDIDVGLHSLKDVPTFLPEGLVLNHFTERGDARDAFISDKAVSLDELPEGATVGTASVRRQSIILNRRPDLKVKTIRGNVDTRMEKLRAGQVDAIILAATGLQRLDRADDITSLIEPEAMLPAVGQGVLAFETRADDHELHTILEAVNHMPTRLTTIAERTLLAVLDGSCSTPIGSYALFTAGDTMRLRGFLATVDGTEMYQVDEEARVTNEDDAHALGLRAGRALKSMVPEAVLLSIAS